MTSVNGSFSVVDSALNTLNKVKQYINAGMETTLDIATDIVPDYEAEGGEHVDRLKEIMISYAKMERKLLQFNTAVEQIKKQINHSGVEDKWPHMEQLLNKELDSLMEKNSDSQLEQHDRFLELKQKIYDLQNQEDSEPQTPRDDSNDMGDEDLICTQKELVTKCPYTGKEMVNPVRNKTCGHSYEREGIEQYIKKRANRAKCPVSGCANQKIITVAELEDNKELRKYIDLKNKQAGNRRRRPANNTEHIA